MSSDKKIIKIFNSRIACLFLIKDKNSTNRIIKVCLYPDQLYMDNDFYEITNGVLYEHNFYKEYKNLLDINDVKLFDDFTYDQLEEYLCIKSEIMKNVLFETLIKEYNFYIKSVENFFISNRNNIRFVVIDMLYLEGDKFIKYMKYFDSVKIYFIQILNKLKIFEENKIIHNDLHLVNIIINKGNAIIYDFDLSYSEKLGKNINCLEDFGYINTFVKKFDLMKLCYYIYKDILDKDNFLDIILVDDKKEIMKKIFDQKNINKKELFDINLCENFRDIDDILNLIK